MNAATLDGLPSGRASARVLRLCAAASLVALATHGPAVRAATLAELFAGGSIDAGAARFQSWQLVSLDATTGPLPDLAQIIVTPLTNPANNPGLQFAGAGQLATSDINALDIIFRYRVSTIGAASSFNGQSLGLTGVTLSGNSGVAYVSHEVTRADGADLAAAVVFSDNETNALQLADESPFAPHTGPWVTVNVFLSGLAIGDAVNLTSFTQRFLQTGPTVLAGDFNLDSAVDGSDFLAWQRGGSPAPVSAQDLADWRANYGVDLNASPAQTATPEPSTTCNLLLGACGILAMRASFKISRPLV
jgi:hypothetical protein